MNMEELRKRIEDDSQLKKDFDFLVAKTGAGPDQLLTGLCLDHNLPSAHVQKLVRREKAELWPISEEILRRTVKNARRVAAQIETSNQSNLLPKFAMKRDYSKLPEILRGYAEELTRRVDLQAAYWKRKRSRIPEIVLLTRRNSLYELIRTSTGKYHLRRLLRLVNAARVMEGLAEIEMWAFTMWLNRLKKRTSLPE